MAINNPRIIGISVRCIKCGWSFRCPAEQPYRARCYACTKTRTRLQTMADENESAIKAIFGNGPEPTRML